ncbi:hypothetical protein F4801DRAFT_53327 [Xylaria longipes]|nr:hypothetical protein F4801DRAFT_53327 [Xylaria longipes]
MKTAWNRTPGYRLHPGAVSNNSVPSTSTVKVLNFHKLSQCWIRHTVMAYSRLAKKQPKTERSSRALVDQLKRASAQQK